MDLTVKSRNAKVSERQRQHIEEKLGKLGRHLDALTSATVEVQTQQQRNAGEMHRVQVTLVGDHGVLLRAEEQSSDLYVAVDAVQEVLQRQIKRYKDRFWRRDRHPRRERPGEAEMAAVVGRDSDEEQSTRDIIRTKQFPLRPMSVDDAIEQMELLGHSFFVFHDSAAKQISVLYRRHDGNYGLIVPEGA